MNEFNAVGFLLVMAGWIFSLCLHEFAHAVVAYQGGDTSVRDKGYFSLNPLAYTDPLNSLVWPLVFLLLGGLGLPGGAVYIDRSRLRSRGWDCAVSLAGPAANAILLAALLVPFWLGAAPERNAGILWQAHACLCWLQVSAILFNLLPVPPLDGFSAVAAFMEPLEAARIYALSSFFFIGLLILMMQTPVGAGFMRVAVAVSLAVGIPLDLAQEGLDMVKLL